MYFSANPKKGVFSNLHLFNLICSCGRKCVYSLNLSKFFPVQFWISAVPYSAPLHSALSGRVQQLHTKLLYKCTLNYEEEKNTFKLDVKIYVLYTVKCIGWKCKTKRVKISHMKCCTNVFIFKLLNSRVIVILIVYSRCSPPVTTCAARGTWARRCTSSRGAS